MIAGCPLKVAEHADEVGVIGDPCQQPTIHGHIGFLRFDPQLRGFGEARGSLDMARSGILGNREPIFFELPLQCPDMTRLGLDDSTDDRQRAYGT